ncbi:Short-chain dehydrogenase [Penicillium argentinense]|uniref:Short-chain dehydrogenase n=1 Tax=Penicillium argentinense TaxID=1131581 RepID=A0A9W9K0Z8_9EURO|nr:Short-chain dehydrogenase [Penicillium argentinense]KAJ5089114.1 Short-chain dehydrogenase [Penicillium argentinense]
MSSRLLNKVSIVTGSSSGLGRAIALRFAREGAKVVCSDLRQSSRLEIEQEITHELIKKDGGQAIFVKADVGVAREIELLVKAAVDEYGRLDIMVNNAGVALEALRPPAMCHQTDISIWDTTLNINARSVFLGCKYAITQMLNQEPHESGDRGWIVNMSSIMALIAGPGSPSYCASKGAVSSLTRQVALDYAQHKIHVNAICPGYTQTAIFKDTTANRTSIEDLQRKHPFNGPGKPDDIAKMAVVLTSDDASWVTGVSWPVDGGYTAR